MIGIRVDSNDIIAMGHLMRCMSIAGQLEKKPIFICSERTTEEFITNAGYKCICLDNQYDEKEQELELLLSVIDENNVELLLIDSYSVTEHYFDVLHNKVKLAYIDDINAFKYNVDILINYTYGTQRLIYDRWNYKNVELLLGSRYVPLRSQFRQLPIMISNVRNIYLTTGGTDGHHMILELIRRLDIKRYGINVVLGKYYKDREQLDKYIKDNSGYRENHDINVYQNISDIADVMKQNDIAISAGGTTLAELASLGIPTICFSMADNQIPGTTKYAQDGLMIYAGDIRTDKNEVIERIVREVQRLTQDRECREEMARRMRESFDGKGAGRIAAILEQN